VVCVLAGHALQDPEATVGYHAGEGDPPPFRNQPVVVDNDFEAILRVIGDVRA